MEERIIDDEYGRGIRLKKTKDGYVDVTDELAEETPETEEAEYEEEVAFEFPMMDTDEDDEDLVGLSPEEAMALRQQKLEAVARRKEEYERTCKEGEDLLASGSFHAAELKYEKALSLDEEATEASVGYWRAKTSDFAEPDVLIKEYVEAGIESLEYDLGYAAADSIKRKYHSVFEKRRAELEAEEKPLEESVEAKQEKRRGYLKDRVKNAGLVFGVSAVPMLVSLILTIVFGLKNFSTPDSRYIIPTAICGGVFAVFLIVFLVLTNRFINACRMYRVNERLSSTEEGQRLQEIREYKELYERLLEIPEENVEETAEEAEAERTEE